MSELRAVGHYVLGEEVAAGGVASLHVGWLRGPAGFSRVCAIKRLHRHLAKVPEFVAMFLDEARLAAKIQHPNVVSILDIVNADGELLLVMDYVRGASLAQLLAEGALTGARVDPSVAVAIAVGVLEGLDAAHGTKDEAGNLLHLIHRDVSPQNILVGADGIPRLVDFGIAKARGRLQVTGEGKVKGKSAYMSPEQLRGRDIDLQSDLWAVGVVLWEMLVGERLFAGDTPTQTMVEVLEKRISPPTTLRPDVPLGVTEVVMKALSRRATARYRSAIEMARTLEEAMPLPSRRLIATWVESLARESMARVDTALAKPHRETNRIASNGAARIGDFLGVTISEIDLLVESTNAPITPVEEVPATLTPTPAPKIVTPKRPRRWLRGGVALLGVALMVWISSVWMRRDSTEATEAAATAPAASAIDSNALAPSSIALSPSFEVRPVGSPQPRPSAKSLDPSGSVGAKRPSRVPRATCNPPFHIESNGVRIPKPECF